MRRLGDEIEDVTLERADGTPVAVSELLDRVLVVQCLRYYG